MADHHNARDNSKRNTYRHYLGRQLSPLNVGGMQWGSLYRSVMSQVWVYSTFVLKPRGLFLLNCKNHIRRGKVIDVCSWHTNYLISLGYALLAEEKVYQSGNRQGANGKLRVDYESVYVFQSNKVTA